MHEVRTGGGVGKSGGDAKQGGGRKTTKRLDRMERLIKEVIAQQGWLKRWVKMIGTDTDNIHLAMDGLYQVEELLELDKSEENKGGGGRGVESRGDKVNAEYRLNGDRGVRRGK